MKANQTELIKKRWLFWLYMSTAVSVFFKLMISICKNYTLLKVNGITFQNIGGEDVLWCLFEVLVIAYITEHCAHRHQGTAWLTGMMAWLGWLILITPVKLIFALHTRFGSQVHIHPLDIAMVVVFFLFWVIKGLFFIHCYHLLKINSERERQIVLGDDS